MPYFGMGRGSQPGILAVNTGRSPFVFGEKWRPHGYRYKNVFLPEKRTKK
jgi:hypothetical protein